MVRFRLENPGAAPKPLPSPQWVTVMADRPYPVELREQLLARLRSGESVRKVAADSGVSASTLYRWLHADPVATDGKLADITGPGITDRWGVTSTDLGASILAPNGKLVSVFGDTFSGAKVGQGEWRSPVILIGTGDARQLIVYERAGGDDPNWARQLWDYIHDDANTGWTRGGISTVLPSDLLRIDDAMYLHVMVNHEFPNVIWTEIWKSDDNGVSWRHMGDKAKFPADLHGGHAQCWSWDYDPEHEWVYVVSTSLRRDKGIILKRVRPEDIGDIDEYEGWGYADGRWAWGNEPTPITPGGEMWGELCLRRLQKGKWILGGFLSSEYTLGYRVVDAVTANMHVTPIQKPVTGCSWDAEDHGNSSVAQLYGGYVLPGSRLDTPGGVGLVVSQWNTAAGWPYRAMQFNATIEDTSAINL
jgi:hypothetical protein